MIRQLIFASLSDPVRKIRLASAALISSIAHPDWPDDWPSLMNELLVLIEGRKDAVDGGMRVLNEFVGVDLTEDQLLPVARSLLPRLLGILGSPQVRCCSFLMDSTDDRIYRPMDRLPALDRSSSSDNA